MSGSDLASAICEAERVFSSIAVRTSCICLFCSFSAFSSEALAMSAALLMLAR